MSFSVIFLSNFNKEFLKINIFDIFLVKTCVICVEIIRKSNAKCQMEVLKVQNSDCNCWNWINSYIFMWKMKMTPGVIEPQYLSFYSTKIQNQGQFWNPQKQTISKLSLLFRFGEDLMKILPKNKLSSFFVDTVYVSSVLLQIVFVIWFVYCCLSVSKFFHSF